MMQWFKRKLGVAELERRLAQAEAQLAQLALVPQTLAAIQRNQRYTRSPEGTIKARSFHRDFRPLVETGEIPHD